MKLLACLLAASCTLFSSAQVVQKSSPTDQDLTTEQTAMVVKLANLQKNFGKKMNSPGADLSLKEIDRSRTSDRTLVKYFLFATGLPTDLTYTLYQVQINGQIIKLFEGVTVDSEGMARCTPRKAPVELVFYAGKAEPKRLSLVSNDSHYKAFISAIPFPSSVTDKACKLESVIGMTKEEVTYIQEWV